MNNDIFDLLSERDNIIKKLNFLDPNNVIENKERQRLRPRLDDIERMLSTKQPKKPFKLTLVKQ